ncbi:uncharacterized protein [Montipora foliosa]|uniref:uncharacterized protein isoform X2 n=1 Tax=Montipora foliosa TaxID=591990 RepID=UPI0035F17337
MSIVSNIKHTFHPRWMQVSFSASFVDLKMLLRLISILAVIPLFIQEVRTEAKIEKSRQYNQQHQPSSGSGEGAEFMSNPQIKGPGEPYRTHYLHARFGIGGQRRKRSPGIEDTLLKIFNIRLPKEKEQT